MVEHPSRLPKRLAAHWGFILVRKQRFLAQKIQRAAQEK